MAMTATARSNGLALRHEIDVNGRHTIVTDEPTCDGGTDRGPAPHELLPAMVASCVSTMIVLYARNRGWQLDDVRVDVCYESDSEPRDVQITVHLPQGLSPDQVKRLRRVADSCPVKRALQAGFTFEERFVFEFPTVRQLPQARAAG
jgi:putative redox protein